MVTMGDDEAVIAAIRYRDKQVYKEEKKTMANLDS